MVQGGPCYRGRCRHVTEQKQGGCPPTSAPASASGTLQRGDLLHTSAVAFETGEPGAEKITHQLDSELGPDDPGTERDDVHVIVLDALVGREGIVTKRTTHSGQLAGGDAGPDTAPADDHPALGLAARDRATHRGRDVRVVVARYELRGVAVDDLESARLQL